MGKKIKTPDEVMADMNRRMVHYGKEMEAAVKGIMPPGTRPMDLIREKFESINYGGLSEETMEALLVEKGMIDKLPTGKGKERSFRNFMIANARVHKNMELRADGLYYLTEKGKVRSDARPKAKADLTVS